MLTFLMKLQQRSASQACALFANLVEKGRDCLHVIALGHAMNCHKLGVIFEPLGLDWGFRWRKYEGLWGKGEA